MKNFAFQYSNNLRIMAYPAYSADFDDMEADLDELEFQEDFVPDVICVDYFDILNPKRKNREKRKAVNLAIAVWER